MPIPEEWNMKRLGKDVVLRPLSNEKETLASVLKPAAAVHQEVCSRSQNELRRYKADLQRVTDEGNSLKLLLGQREEEIKDLRDELAKAYRDQTDLFEQLQQKNDMIRKLREVVDVIKAESLQWKEGMDRFATEKETARAQLSSAETQLQRMKAKELEVDAEALVSDDDDDDNDDDDGSKSGSENAGSLIEKRSLLGMTRKLSP
ncbi:uncharacterized protein [Nicotiana tomentosiformis]|uniref:uncharacterized protein n=1 Tax=Nicotiana tomentosiformis TaxID=4098 RepID=UPI00388C420F